MNTFWSDLGSALLGKNEPGLLAAAFVFALIGHALVLLGGTMLRDPKSLSSPQKFSVPYLLWDNSKRIAYVLILIIVCLRFSPDLLGRQLDAFTGFLVGLGLDSLGLLLKQKTRFFDPSPKP